MDTSDRPAATIHPGAVRAIFDHLILSLTADGTPGDPVFLFSHYRFRWAADGIVGDLAFVELERGGGPERILVTSEPALAVAQAARLSPRGWAEVDVARSPMVAAFRGTPLAGSTVGETVIGNGLRLEVGWSELSAPVFATGPAPRAYLDHMLQVIRRWLKQPSHENREAVRS